MKIIVLCSMIISILLYTGCTDFPTAYHVIESDKIRLIDFIYEPAEAAPGDTVLLKAIFAGKNVTADDVTWRISKKIIQNEYGIRAALDTVPLEVNYKECSFSENTSCMTFTFKVPENVLSESPFIPDNWNQVLPDYYRNAIPSSIPRSKQTILEMIRQIDADGQGSQLLADSAFSTFFPVMLQCCSAPVSIFCNIRNSHMIKSDYIVRYNSRFSDFPEMNIPVNHNPEIDSIYLYTIGKKDLMDFDPSNTDLDFTTSILRQDSVNTIKVDNSYSYFIGLLPGKIDTTLSIDALMGNSKPLAENQFCHWYISFDDNERKDVKISDLLEIDNGSWMNGRLICRLFTPLSDDIRNAVAWVELKDQFINENCRPSGSTVGEIQLHFDYK